MTEKLYKIKQLTWVDEKDRTVSIVSHGVFDITYTFEKGFQLNYYNYQERGCAYEMPKLDFNLEVLKSYAYDFHCRHLLTDLE